MIKHAKSTWNWIKVNRTDLLPIITAVIAFCLLVGGINQVRQLRDQTEQIKIVQNQNQQILQQLKQATDDLKENTSSQFEKQRAFDLCIIKFFGRPNRQSLVLEDVCTIKASSLPTPTDSNNEKEQGSSSRIIIKQQSSPPKQEDQQDMSQFLQPTISPQCSIDVLRVHIGC